MPLRSWVARITASASCLQAPPASWYSSFCHSCTWGTAEDAGRNSSATGLCTSHDAVHTDCQGWCCRDFFDEAIKNRMRQPSTGNLYSEDDVIADYALVRSTPGVVNKSNTMQEQIARSEIFAEN